MNGCRTAKDEAQNEIKNMENFKTDILKEDPCGCMFWKPRFLQVFNDIRWHVLFQCIFSFFQGFIVNGVINVIIPALEKRYGLSSSRSSLIASSNDWGAFVLFIIVGYFGENRCKPKLMASGIFLMSIGCLMFVLPQFIGERYTYVSSTNSDSEDSNLCSLTANSSANNQSANSDLSDYGGYYALFVIGNALLGIGAVPMFTLGLTYLDENCKPQLTSLFIALNFCSSAIGVAIGYILGGQTLSYYVDIDKVDPSTVSLSLSDPQWVGAWWIGVLVALASFLLIGAPIYGYPKRLPGYEELQKMRKSEAHSNGAEQITSNPKFGESWRDFPRSFVLLIKNPTFWFICMAATTEALLIAGLATFGSKILSELYQIDLTEAGRIMGILTIPGSGGGMIVGGYLVKRFKMNCRQIIRFSTMCMFISALLAPSFLAGCPGRPIAGVTTGYPTSSDGRISLGDVCNKGCGCTTSGFEPLCDFNSTVYFSPCHAGCRNVTMVGSSKHYYDCSCITEEHISTEAKGGRCSEKCVWFYVFCALLLLLQIFTFMTMSPVVTAVFRCVPHKQRSLALSAEQLIVRLCGTMPGSILIGAIIDSSCSVWQEEHGQKGSCWIYEKSDLSLRLVVWWAGLNMLGVILYIIAERLYKPPDDQDCSHDDIKETCDSDKQIEFNSRL